MTDAIWNIYLVAFNISKEGLLSAEVMEDVQLDEVELEVCNF